MAERWWLINNTSRDLTIGDIPELPVIPPGKREDALLHTSKERIGQSSFLSSLLSSNAVDLIKENAGANEEVISAEQSDLDNFYTKTEVDTLVVEGGSGDTSLDNGVLVYNVLEYDLVADGSTDNTADFLTLLQTVYDNGGGTIFFPEGTYRFDGQIILPYSLSGTVNPFTDQYYDNKNLASENQSIKNPTQPAMRIMGSGALFSGRGTEPLGGTILDMRYQAANSTSGGFAKLITLGLGYLEIDHITFTNTQSYETANALPYILTINTTLHLHDCGFYGNQAGSALNTVSGSGRWVAINASRYTAAPVNAYEITMSNTTGLSVGGLVRVAQSGRSLDGYGYISRVTSNTSIQITGTNLTVGNITGLYYEQATNQEDAIILGGEGTLWEAGTFYTSVSGGVQRVGEGYASVYSGFQGYGTIIEKNYFSRIQRGVYMKTYSNALIIRDNVWWNTCGGVAAIESNCYNSGAANVGASITGNLFEMTGYSYGVKMTQTQRFAIFSNSFYDAVVSAGGPAIARYYFSSNSINNTVLDSYDDNLPSVPGEVVNDPTYYGTVDEKRYLTLNAPITTSTGVIYLVGSSPSGAFSGQAGKLATYNGAAWVFTDPRICSYYTNTIYSSTSGTASILGNTVRALGDIYIDGANGLVKSGAGKILSYRNNQVGSTGIDIINLFEVVQSSNKNHSYVKIAGGTEGSTDICGGTNSLGDGNEVVLRLSCNSTKTERTCAIRGTTAILRSDAGNTLQIGVAGSSSEIKIGNASTMEIGFYGANPVVQPTALTAANASALNSGDATTDTVIANMRTRIGELESKLQSLGLLA